MPPAGRSRPSTLPMKLSPDALKQLVRLLHDGVPLLRLLADAEQPDGRIRAAEDVLGVDGAEPRELHQLLGRAVDVGARVEDDDRLVARSGKSVAIAGRLRPACSLSRTIDAAICAPVLPAETNASDLPSACSRRPTTIELFGLPRTRGRRLVRHLDDVGRLDDRRCGRDDARAPRSSPREERVELRLDDGGAGRRAGCVCAGSSSASASSAPATVAWGAKSPPMASNAIRAKARLPWLLLAAHRRSTRTPRRRGAGASSPGSAGTSGSRSRARSCACCARASSSSRYVASGRPWDLDR